MTVLRIRLERALALGKSSDAALLRALLALMALSPALLVHVELIARQRRTS